MHSSQTFDCHPILSKVAFSTKKTWVFYRSGFCSNPCEKPNYQPFDLSEAKALRLQARLNIPAALLPILQQDEKKELSITTM